MGKKNSKRGLSLKQLKVIELLAMKSYNNMTNQQIADEVGINIQTFYEWKKQEEFVEELNRTVEFMNKAFLEEAMSQLQRIISGTNISESNRIKAIELFLKQQGQLKQTNESKVSIKVEEESVDDILNDLGIEDE